MHDSISSCSRSDAGNSTIILRGRNDSEPYSRSDAGSLFPRSIHMPAKSIEVQKAPVCRGEDTLDGIVAKTPP